MKDFFSTRLDPHRKSDALHKTPSLCHAERSEASIALGTSCHAERSEASITLSTSCHAERSEASIANGHVEKLSSLHASWCNGKPA